ncbi:hypothetical protein Scep_026659 [Stephania cephalantha]|uniref:Reverse transcriptase zinc-binding domain-containing protein n=1 Tax=Stephania cephalantha TaxID=152367 RepID=A0AAP0HTI0_9MAGN
MIEESTDWEKNRIWQHIWRWKGPQLVRSFLWLFNHEWLATNLLCASRGMKISQRCPCCGGAKISKEPDMMLQSQPYVPTKQCICNVHIAVLIFFNEMDETSHVKRRFREVVDSTPAELDCRADANITLNNLSGGESKGGVDIVVCCWVEHIVPVVVWNLLSCGDRWRLHLCCSNHYDNFG